MSVSITYCEPRSAWTMLPPEPQFAKNQQRPISVTFDSHGVRDSTGIDFDSYSRMQTTKKEQSNFWRTGIPSWVMNPAKLREVIVHAVEQRAALCSARNTYTPTGTHADRLARAMENINRKRAAKIATLDACCSRYLAALEAHAPRAVVAELESQIENLDTALRVDENPTAYISAVLYLSYRARMNSTQVGSALGLKPPHCRQILHRANIIAKQIEGGNA